MNRIALAFALGASLLLAIGAVASEPQTVAGQTLDQWSRQLDSSDRNRRLVAVVTLRQFGGDGVVPLISALASADEGVRFWAASSLGDLAEYVRQRPQAAALRKTLDDLIEYDLPSVRLAAAYARCRLKPDDRCVALLATALASPQRGVCVTAADYLGAIGPDATAAIVSLQAATKHADYHVADSARRALRAVRSGASPEP